MVWVILQVNTTRIINNQKEVVWIRIWDGLPDIQTKSSCTSFSTNDYTNYKTALNDETSTTDTSIGLSYKNGIIPRLRDFLIDTEVGMAQFNLDFNQEISKKSGYSDIITLIEKLEKYKLHYNFASQCQAEQTSLDLNEYTSAKDIAEESKLRLDGIRNSDTQVSYYEGWFPLFRPMSETALFGLFSVSIAILLASIVMYLRMQGIELQILMPASSLGTMAIFDTLRQYSSYIWFAIAGGFAIGFAAYKMEWV